MEVEDTTVLGISVTWGRKGAGDDAGLASSSCSGDECTEVFFEYLRLFEFDVVCPYVDDDSGDLWAGCSEVGDVGVDVHDLSTGEGAGLCFGERDMADMG